MSHSDNIDDDAELAALDALFAAMLADAQAKADAGKPPDPTTMNGLWRIRERRGKARDRIAADAEIERLRRITSGDYAEGEDD